MGSRAQPKHVCLRETTINHLSHHYSMLSTLNFSTTKFNQSRMFQIANYKNIFDKGACCPPRQGRKTVQLLEVIVKAAGK